MVKRTDSTYQAPPLSIVRGEQINATYSEQLIPEYQSIPIVEALPPIWTMEEVERKLSYFPSYDPKQSELPDEIRLHLLENAREFFIPQGIHYEIHLSISNMLRRGYIDRNPIKRGVWSGQMAKVKELGHRLQRKAFLRSKARGMCIVGLSGIGKSTAVENILSLYPQVITHTNYKGQDLILKQLVWVKLQCPSDGSLKGLCVNYIEEVDDILGTNYVSFYNVRRRTVDELLIIMARVASNHFQGVIVFDEIQDLSEAKSGGAARMLNFFVQLENTLGIPFVLIATPKAKTLLSGEFRQARRISEQGDIYWRPMRQIRMKEKTNERDVVDPDWNDFVRAMWRYWYLRKAHPLPKNLLDDPVIEALYEQSKGITALVVTIFFLAQRRAIVSRREDLTDTVIKSIIKDNQYFISQVLNQIREPLSAKGHHTAISDIDKSAWQLHHSATHTQGIRQQQEDCIGSSSSRRASEKSDTNSSPAKVRKSRKEKEGVPTYEDEDFRSLKTRQAGEGSNNSSDINSFFASIDELS